jgi:hypothetical protein
MKIIIAYSDQTVELLPAKVGVEEVFERLEQRCPPFHIAVQGFYRCPDRKHHLRIPTANTGQHLGR